jgi:hypothetical protein
MKQIRIVFAMMPLLFLSQVLLPQSKGIVLTGKVISFEEHAPIEGVTVQVKGTKNVSGTMYDGMYAIEISPVDSILVFSSEGYVPTEVRIIEDKKEYNVILKSSSGSSIDSYPLWQRKHIGD